MSLNLAVLPVELVVCRLPAKSTLPAWASLDDFASVTWTPDETSVVCSASSAPAEVPIERGWRAIKVAGPLDFSLTGILSAIARPLAEAGVSIFAISTYDTDYVLVRQAALNAAVDALTAAGHHVE